MELSPKHFDVTLDSFLSSWDLERIKNMSIHEYANLSDHDSLCYWLEYGTKNLGAIGRISLNKFELWKPRDGKDKEFKDGRFQMEGVYAWNTQKGSTLEQAFSTIKQLIVDIVVHALNQNWAAIDGIRFHAIAKWKIACLFSKKQLLPVYSMRALLAIVNGLGHTFTAKDKVSVIQAAIIGHKPEDEDIVDFSYRIYTQFASRDKISNRNYYIVGSKYSDDNGNDTISVVDEFIKHGCVAIGWLDWLDFSHYMGKQNEEINSFVTSNWTGAKPTLGKIKGYFRLMAQMKAGDIIAVKSQGAYGQLKIIAYAEVVERKGSIYWHDEDVLGHHIHVEFLDAGFVNDTGETYAGTIHRLTREKDGTAFNKIFGWYAGSNLQEVDPEEADETSETIIDETDEEGYNEKVETSFERSAIASVTVNRVHNRIQNRFIQYLKETYPNDLCSGEKKYIDARRISSEGVFIYEIKPFANVYTCIRQGIGQLFDYMHQEKSKKQKRIMIVGPNEPNPADLKFLEEIKKMLSVPFAYVAFDESTMTAKEY
ncbi:hypothetical protein D3C87_298990 [compost metagenome]